MGLHLGNDELIVQARRQRLMQDLDLPSAPTWIKQVHGTNIVVADNASADRTADGSVYEGRGVVLAVVTADCLPVFLADPERGRIGLLHAGWRGLAAGIIERGIAQLGSPRGAVQVAFGPALGPANFEVGDEVRDALMRPGTGDRMAFARGERPGKWLCDLYQLAAGRVVDMGCRPPSIPSTCTYQDEHLWFSYRRHSHRRDARTQSSLPDTGRMVSLIWID